MKILVELAGGLDGVAKTKLKQYSVDVSPAATVRDVILEFLSQHVDSSKHSDIVRGTSGTAQQMIKPGVLVLLGDTDVECLSEGIDTEVKEDVPVVLISTLHGG